MTMYDAHLKSKVVLNNKLSLARHTYFTNIYCISFSAICDNFVIKSLHTTFIAA
jgi:hypothetical protein